MIFFSHWFYIFKIYKNRILIYHDKYQAKYSCQWKEDFVNDRGGYNESICLNYVSGSLLNLTLIELWLYNPTDVGLYQGIYNLTGGTKPCE